MKKADLKTGMRVRVGKEEDYGIILLDTDNSDVIIYHDSYDPLCNFDDYLNHITKPEYSIKEVRSCPNIIKYSLDFEKTGCELWTRPEKPTTYILDGIAYSESTLRSIIKKAH